MDKITELFISSLRLHCHIQRVVVTPSLACLFIDYMHDENLNTISTFWIPIWKRH